MVNRTVIGILLMVTCTIFTAIGQLFFKYSSTTFSLDFISLITNYDLIIGFVFYGLGALLLIIALNFGELSKLFPFVSLNFVWIILLSVFVLGESLNSFKINAIILVILGIIFIGGSK